MHTKELIESWSRIWRAVYEGNKAAVNAAVVEHISRFHPADQQDAQRRASRILETAGYTGAGVARIIQRSGTTLHKLNKTPAGAAAHDNANAA